MRNVLREKRMELYPRMSMKQFAKEIGVGRSAYGCWETGERFDTDRIDQASILKVANALRMTPEAVKEAISNNYMTKQSGEMEKARYVRTSRPMASGVSNCLTEWRYNEHLTQKEAGELLGISQSTYGWIERGMTKPEGKLLNDIIELTGLSMHQIASIFTGSSVKNTFIYQW